MSAAGLAVFAARLAAVVAIAAVAVIARRRATAAEQHVMWMAALVGALLLPFVTLALPTWRVGPTIAALQVSQPSPSSASPQRVVREIGSDAVPRAAERAITSVAPSGSTSQSSSPSRSRGAIETVLILWAGGTLLCLVRLARAHSHARQIVKSARPIVGTSRVSAGIMVLESLEATGPFTYGVWRRSIIMPVDAVQWLPERRLAVLTHEEAHALRYDGLSLLIAEIASAIYWWHPGVLFAARRAAIACERACDDAVMRGGTRASDYGAQLLAQAQTDCAWGMRPLATTLFWPSHGVATRIAALLDPRIDRRPLARHRVVAVGALGLGCLALVAAAAPRVPPAAPGHPFVNAAAPAVSTVPQVVERVESPATSASRTARATSRRRSTIAFAPACTQADARYARTLHVDSSLSFRGAGSTHYPDGSLLLVWTGLDCTAWLRIRGAVGVNSTWTAVSVSPGGEFVAHDDGPGGKRDYVVRPDGSVSLSINGAQVALGAEHREWTSMMILEYVRRTGLDATVRARNIVATGGVAAILDEASKISGKEVRARYLETAFPTVSPDKRAAFLRDAAALLDSAFVRGKFILSVPQDWRTDQGVLAAMYAEAGVIEPDAYVEQILRAAPPPRPLPPALKPLIERMIASLQSIDRRTALGAYYLDVRP